MAAAAAAAAPMVAYDPLGLLPIYPTLDQVNAFAAAVSNTGIGSIMQMFNDVFTTNELSAPIAAAMRGWAKVYTFPTSQKLPMSDPVDVVFCLVVYFALLFVFFLIGRVTGKLELRGFGVVYNFLLVLLSGYMAVTTAYATLMAAITSKQFGTTGPLPWWNIPVAAESNPWSMPCAIACWIFAMSKLVEFMDTYIMMLKHNYRQVSFLHLYHHSSIVVVAWVISSVSPGGDTYWSASVNSGIHVVMYLYYLLNLLFRTGAIRNFLQRNKFIITYGQLLQFLLNFIQTVYVLVLSGVTSPSSFFTEYVRVFNVIMTGGKDSPQGFWWELLGVGDGSSRAASNSQQSPALPMHINFWYMITMLVLFSNFLVKNKKASKKAAASKAAAKKVKQD